MVHTDAFTSLFFYWRLYALCVCVCVCVSGLLGRVHSAIFKDEASFCSSQMVEFVPAECTSDPAVSALPEACISNAAYRFS